MVGGLISAPETGKQCAIVWYIDDKKISHKDPKVVTEILEIMKKYFGELVIHRVCVGKNFDFLGMGVTITEDKKIQIETKD